MPVLEWGQPPRVHATPEAWAESAGFEDGPRGGYEPNMDELWRLKWKAKLAARTTDHPQVEIRKSTKDGTQITIVVSLGNGYNYKNWRHDSVSERPEDYPVDPDPDRDEFLSRADIERMMLRNRGPATKGINVHVAMNGPLRATFEEMWEMQAAIEEARAALEALASATRDPLSGAGGATPRRRR